MTSFGAPRAPSVFLCQNPTGTGQGIFIPSPPRPVPGTLTFPLQTPMKEAELPTLKH